MPKLYPSLGADIRKFLIETMYNDHLLIMIMIMKLIILKHAPINVKPQGREFEVGRPDSHGKSLPRDRNWTFSKSLGVGNLTLASVKMSNSPGSAPHPVA